MIEASPAQRRSRRWHGNDCRPLGAPGWRRDRGHEVGQGFDEPALSCILPCAHDACGRVIVHNGARACIERKLVPIQSGHRHRVAFAALHAPERRPAARTCAPPVKVGEGSKACLADCLARRVANRAARGPKRFGQGGARSFPVSKRTFESALPASGTSAIPCSFPRAARLASIGIAGDALRCDSLMLHGSSLPWALQRKPCRRSSASRCPPDGNQRPPCCRVSSDRAAFQRRSSTSIASTPPRFGARVVPVESPSGRARSPIVVFGFAFQTVFSTSRMPSMPRSMPSIPHIMRALFRGFS